MLSPRMAKNHERKDLTMPIGLHARVQKLLGGRGFSKLVTRLLLQWEKNPTKGKPD